MRFIENLGDLTTPYLHLKSLNCDQLSLDTSREKIPYLVFDYTITTNQFHGSIYRKPLSKDRIRLQRVIMKLNNKHFHKKINKDQLDQLTTKGFKNFRVKKIILFN